MNTIVVDIETGPLPEAELAALVPPFDPAEVKTGNLKDPEKIAAKLAEAEANHRRDFFDRAALDPLTGRVVAIGVMVFESGPGEEPFQRGARSLERGAVGDECGVRILDCGRFEAAERPCDAGAAPHPGPLPFRRGEGVGSAERGAGGNPPPAPPGSGAETEDGRVFIIGHENEAQTLRTFWAAVRGEMGRIHPMVGFNICNFDLPFLIRRSWKHGVQVPFGIRRGRYWGEQVIDLRELWQLGDRQARGSLDSIARHLGVGAKNGDGKEFAALWQSDRPKAEAYLRNDLDMTARVAGALGVCV